MKKDVLMELTVGIVTFTVAIGGIFAIGKLDNKFLATIGKERASIKREVFKESKSYVEGMVEDLSSYKREFDRTDDVDEKEQIANIIHGEFANFDINKIEDSNLRGFLLDIREGNWE